jgi:hypothetical protein
VRTADVVVVLREFGARQLELLGQPIAIAGEDRLDLFESQQSLLISNAAGGVESRRRVLAAETE